MDSESADTARERRIAFGVAIAFFIGLTALLLGGHLRGADQRLTAMYFDIRGELEPGDDVVICSIDARSLNDLGQWPWDLYVHARLLRKLDAAGARVVAFDISELARTRRRDFTDAEVADFSKALSEVECGVVVPVVLEPDTEQSTGGPPPELEGRSIGSGRLPRPPNFHPGRVNLPATSLVSAADGVGFLNVFPDLDGTVRTVPLSVSYGGRLYPSFVLECYRLHTRAPLDSVRLESSTLTAAHARFPVLPSGEMMVNYAGGHTFFPAISCTDVYSDSTRDIASRVANKTVLVGPYGSGLSELFRTPVDARLPGVEVNANAVTSMLANRVLRRAPDWSAIVIMGGIAILLALLVPAAGAPGGAAVTLLVLAATIGLAYLRFCHNVIVPMGGPALLTALLGATLVTRSAATAERRRAEADIAFQSRMQVITGIGRLVDSSLERSELLEEIMRWVEAELHVEAASMLLVDPETRTLHFEVALGEKGDAVKGFVLDMGEGIAGQVAETGEPLIVSDAAADPRHHQKIPEAIGYQVYNILCVPMMFRGEVVGVIEAMNRTDGRPFTDQDSALLTVIAQEAALFLENARLYSILQNRVDFANAELRETNQELASEKAKVETMVEEMVDGVVATDEAGRIVLLNEAAEKILSVSGDDVVGADAVSVINQPDLKRLMNMPLDSPGGVYTEEVEIGDERSTVLQVSVAIYGDGDEISGRCLILTDITEFKRIDQLKTDLIGFVAHELKTPLTNIGLYSEMLQNRLVGEDEKIEHITDVINRQGGRMRHMVEDFLNISRLEADREIPMDMRRIDDIGGLIGDTVAVHTHPQVEEEISIQLPDDQPPLWADKTKVEEVFANLLSNARKFSPEGGPIEVRGECDGDQWRFSVSDEGMGIPKTKQDQLFRRFERLDASASRIPGTGLGLFVCKHLVEAHGGEIWVESEEGEGSTFYFTLPVYSGQDAQAPAPEDADEA